MVQRDLAMALAAKVHGRRDVGVAHIGTQRTDVHHALHARCCTGARKFLRQFNVHLVKRFLGAMQDGHQIDDGVVPGYQLHQRIFVVNVGREHIQCGQHLDIPCVCLMARGDCYPPLQLGKLFTDMAANKASAAEDQYFFDGHNHD